MTSVNISDSVTSIGSYAFEGCSSLTSITIPNSVTRIESYAFEGCSLQAINVNIIDFANNNITSRINSSEYHYYYDGIKIEGDYVIPNGVGTIGNMALYKCTDITSIVIPDSVTTISMSAFSGCTGMRSVTIGKSVTIIGSTAFASCSGLTSITIPNSVTVIAPGVFVNCSALTSVKVSWNNPLSISSVVFNNVNLSNITLYVPAGTKTLYEAADVWKDFGTIEEYGGNVRIVDKDGNVEQLSLSDNDAIQLQDNFRKLEISENIELSQLSYSRTFKNANWQPLYVPFDMTVTSDLLQRFSFAKFAGTYTEEDDFGNVAFFITIVRLKEGATIKANTPYFIQAKTADASNAQTISVDGTTLHKTEEMNFSMYSAEKKLSVYGIYNQKICAYDGEYYAYSAGKYSRQLTGAKLGAFRFYVTIENREDNPYGTSSPAEIKLKVVGDDATGISNANVDADINGNCFNLAGQVVAPDYKGIVIKNGKKMYNK